jgi:glycosyltransferase involved in cell wall biosynthesis
VIPTYNWSSVLRHSIASALAQTYPALEVIVVGDACTDDSAEVVASFRDPRVRWDNLERNSGAQSFPNNRGIELARGEYVAYLGHDDLWLPTHLDHLVCAIQRSGAGLVYAAVNAVGPPGSNLRWISGLRGKPPSGVLHRRDVVARVGGWRDFRTIVDPPDAEFIDRVSDAYGAAFSGALSVCKFPSGWRRDSYITRRDDEQRLYAARMARERMFVERETLTFLWLYLRRAPQSLPALEATPDDVPPGWYVGQLRRIRGLPNLPREER